MATQTFINLPVKDVARATTFFTEAGFDLDHQLGDDTGARVILGDGASVMLADESSFAGYIAPQAIADTAASRETIVGLSAESRAEVDERVDRAVAAGARALGDAQDDGFMYMRGFVDPDGHQWSFVHMDMTALHQA